MPARARGLNEPERSDRLARPGRMLEPETPGGVRILRRVAQLDVLVKLGVILPVARLLILVAVLCVDVELLVLLAGDRGRRQLDRP